MNIRLIVKVSQCLSLYQGSLYNGMTLNNIVVNVIIGSNGVDVWSRVFAFLCTVNIILIWMLNSPK
jgi:hypothetical protein